MNISWKFHACIIKWSISLDFLTKLLSSLRNDYNINLNLKIKYDRRLQNKERINDLFVMI